MGIRGRQPESPQMRLLKGAKSGPRRADPTAGAPEMPDWLDPIARELWRDLVAVLGERGTITRADRSALEVLCVMYSQWRRAVAELEASGFASETAAGNPKPSPLVGAVNQCASGLLAWLKEFGLTPASRGRVEPVASLVAMDELEEFLSGQ